MADSALQRYLDAGEGTSVEFKRCGGKPERDVFETVCSFANRQGGSILLGVLDDGTVEGVPEGSVRSIERSIVNVANNPNLFNVAPSLETERLTAFGGETVIRVWVPMGPALYTFKGEVFDRVADVDVRVKSEAQKAAMIVRKQGFYTERTVYPWLTEDDLELGLLADVRAAVGATDANHPWLSLDDRELLRAARLYARDPSTGERGFNLAAAVLLGKDEAIGDVVPTYRTDVAVRRLDVDRYDDRLVCTSNLVRAYGEIVAFCERWLPDSFVLDGPNRVSARDVIVRELVSNSLVHREFTSPYIARITIDVRGISTRNASRSLYSGPVTLDNLDPTPKNPVISGFFAQMGRAEELGSGTRNLYKYSRLYTGLDPKLADGDFFTAFVPAPDVLGAAPESVAPEGGGQRAIPSDEISNVVAELLERRGKFAASEVSERVKSVGGRTVRRHLAAMVSAGELETEARGRSTVYWRKES